MTPAPQPFFLDGARGALFCIWYPAAAGPARCPLLHLPAFGDEMNRSRRMVALAAREFAAAGRGTLILDPLGTGDSEGELRDARWDAWLADAARALTWLESHGRPIIWGHRLGALLAAQLAARHGAESSALLLWNPVTNGKRHLTQLLRVRVAASMMRDERETVEGLREQLGEHGLLEVAGYELSSALGADIDAQRLGPPTQPGAWFDVSSSAEPALTPAATRAVDAWRAAVDDAADVSAGAVAGEPFWTTQEIATAPALIEQTSAWLAGRLA